jgi:hypothetical protein
VPVTIKDVNPDANGKPPLVVSCTMVLRAVVCIQQSHYVAYARMPVNQDGVDSRRWVFSDSMADNRAAKVGGFESLPSTKACPKVRSPPSLSLPITVTPAASFVPSRVEFSELVWFGDGAPQSAVVTRS